MYTGRSGKGMETRKKERKLDKTNKQTDDKMVAKEKNLKRTDKQKTG